MGTYRGFRVEIVGDYYEAPKLAEEIKSDPELASMYNKWDGGIKNWCPDDKLRKISEDYKESYIILTTAEESSEAYQTIYYRGMGMNAECDTLRRYAPFYAVKQVRRRLLEREKQKASNQ